MTLGSEFQVETIDFIAALLQLVSALARLID
jgi:hypothetical protein